MLKKFFVILFLILISPFSVQAHTTLLTSTPAEGENVTEALEQVELIFGTKIEEGSTMTIEGESESFEFDSITIMADSMVGDFSETLDNGSYRILWTIIGEDGHPIEGEIAFGVSIEAEEVVAALAGTKEAEELEEETVAVSEEAEAAEVQTENDSNPIVTILLVLVAIAVIFGIYKLLMKKK
ncbi:copper resistance protein CopC [Planococcus antarcticus DSM 14505]|uniref:Copper resistance protein CopC n=1 Tax=Planococcus antarcticus DSM 14505 TaxID=1185653 RepID=A0ABM6D3W6_9BACL|nr:copper resistance CopC family protein [Planococcus antarcticus]ANU09957.1 copper resistance protein CopC [Planococcus antarcticus DSM 14505]